MSLLTDLISAWELSESSSPRLDFNDGNDLTSNYLTTDIGTGTGLVYALAANLENSTALTKQSFSCASNASLQTGDINFSIEAWINLASFPSAAVPVIGKTNDIGSPSVSEYGLFGVSGAYFIWRISNGSAFTDLNATNFGAPVTSSWTQVIASHDATNNVLRIRVNNGTANTSSYSGGGTTNSSPLRLGHDGSVGDARFVNGLMGPVRFWKKVLTTDEEDELWNGGAGLPYADFGGGGATKMGFQYYAQRVIGSPL